MTKFFAETAKHPKICLTPSPKKEDIYILFMSATENNFTEVAPKPVQTKRRDVHVFNRFDCPSVRLSPTFLADPVKAMGFYKHGCDSLINSLSHSLFHPVAVSSKYSDIQIYLTIY